MSVTQEEKSVALDALALIGAAFRGDVESGQALLSTFTTADEQRVLFASVLGHTVCILRYVSEAAGIDPEKVLGAVGTTIRSEQ